MKEGHIFNFMTVRNAAFFNHWPAAQRSEEGNKMGLVLALPSEHDQVVGRAILSTEGH